MKTNYLPLVIGMLFVVFSGFIALSPNGAPAAKTGSPGDGSECTECHGGTAATVSGWITSNIPAQGYVPGQTYQITATNQITGSGKMGFEVSPQNVSGSLLGTLTPGSGSKLVGNGKYVTHSNANTTNNTWTFNWTAPVAGTGVVTFYGAFARNKPGPVKLSTLVVNEQTVSLPSAAGPISGSTSVCKNNSFTYSIGSIAGATNYVWSVPTGATIASGQGTTSISVNYGVLSSSGNISVYGSNSAGNGTPSSLAITVNSAPTQPSAIAGTVSPCQGTVQLYSVSNIAGVNYTWTVPDGSMITAGQGTNSITMAIGSASGTITVVPGNSCGIGVSRNLSLTISSLPGISATPTGPEVVDLNSTSTSEYTTTGATEGSSYEWELSPASAGTITGSGLTASVSWGSFLGDATVRVKALNSCGSGSWSVVKQTIILNTTAITETDKTNQMSVYPNPNNGQFDLELKGKMETAILMLLDASGREVFRAQVNNKGKNSLNLSIGSGVFILIVNDGENVLQQKLLIR